MLETVFSTENVVRGALVITVVFLYAIMRASHDAAHELRTIRELLRAGLFEESGLEPQYSETTRAYLRRIVKNQG